MPDVSTSYLVSSTKLTHGRFSMCSGLLLIGPSSSRPKLRARSSLHPRGTQMEILCMSDGLTTRASHGHSSISSIYQTKLVAKSISGSTRRGAAMTHVYGSSILYFVRCLSSSRGLTACSWKDILMRQMNTDKKERSKNAQGNNINMMVGRGRDRYKILTWDVDERRKNHVDWLDQMTDQQKHHNTTRGLTPGLIDPALGEQPGNRIPIPPSIAGAGLQKTMVGRRRQEKAKKDQELTQSRTRSPEEDATATNLVLQAHVQKAKERRARSSRKRTKAPADRSNLGRPSDTSQSQGQPDAVAGMTETPPTNADYLPEGHLDYTSQFEYGPTAVTQSSADPWQSYPHAQPQQVNVPISPYTTEPNVSYGNQSHAPPRSSQPRTYADAVASGTMHGRNHTWQLAPLDQRQQFNAPMGSYMGARGDQHLGQSQFAAGPSPQIFYSTGPALQNRHRDYARTGHSQQFYTSGPAAVANMGQVYDFPWDGTQQFYHYQQPQQFQQSSQYYPLQQHHLHQGRQSQYPRQPQHSRHLQHPQYSQQDRHPPYPQQPQQRQSSQHPRQPLSHQPTAAGHQQPTRHPSNRPESRQLEHQQRVQQLYEEAWARESGQNDQYAPPSERR